MMALTAKTSSTMSLARNHRASKSRAYLRVVASASPSGPSPSDPTPTPLGTPPTSSPVFLRASGPGGPSGPIGTGGSGYGGGGGNRPVGTGGPSGGSSGPGGNVPGLPSGWTWDRILLTALGVSLAIPAFKYLNRRFLLKPEPEHTLAKVEDAAADVKHKSSISKAVSAVKHATVEPVTHLGKDIKHSDTARTVQHGAEKAKDAVDIGAYDATSKASRAGSHVSKDIKHAAENVKEKVEDVMAGGDRKTHEAGVKGTRAVQQSGDRVSDAAYHTKRGVFDGLKGLGRAVGLRESAPHKAERKVKEATTGTNKNVYYITGGVLLGSGLLAAAYYAYDKSGDIGKGMRRLQDKTRELTGKAKDKVAAPPAGAAPPGVGGTA